MILLNGVPPIIGVGLLHVTIINVLAITFEYFYLKRRLDQNHLLMRTILANLFSLTIGVVVMITISHLLPGNITRLGMDSYELEDRLAMIPSLLGLVISNILLEVLAFLINQKQERKKVIKHVTIANLFTNIPIVVFYGMLAI